MSRRTLAWAAWFITIVFVAAAVVLSVINGWGRQTILEAILIPLQAVAYSTVGLLIMLRRDDNSVGLLFAWVGIFAGGYALAFEYATLALFTEPGALPLARAITWLQAWVYVPALGVSFLFVPLLFPTGHLLSKRWRPVAFIAAGAIASISLGDALRPGPIDDFPVSNPLGLTASAHSVLELSVPFLFGPATVLCVAALIIRWRRARGVERQQLKWFAFAAAFLPVNALSWAILDFLDVQGPAADAYEQILASAAFLGLPIATGIAILRYRLYDIDRIVSRTLAYGLLTAVLAGGYFLAVLALQSVLPLAGDSPLIVAASTLAVVAAFGPLRSRIQSVVDRRFNRSRYDAARTVETFGSSLRRETDLDELRSDLVALVEATMQPSHASLWLHSSPRSER